MSVEKAKEFLLALKEKGADEAWEKKAAEAKTEEEKFALMADMAKEMGYDLTADDVKEALNTLAQEDKDLVPLEDAEVESVAGGADDEVPASITANCAYCGKEVTATYTGYTSHFLFLFTTYIFKCDECGNELQVWSW